MKDVSLLSDEELNVVVAKLCGWSVRKTEANLDFPFHLWSPSNRQSGGWKTEKGAWSHGRPDYCNSLDAMHEAEKIFNTPDLEVSWIFKLRDVVLGINVMGCFSMSEGIDMLKATARQRAEAFVKTMESTSVPDGSKTTL